MKLAIIRTLRRIANAMEGRADFPPVKRAGIEPDAPWDRPLWCAWEGANCGQPVDCLLYGCGAERAANADGTGDGERFCLHPQNPNAPIGEAAWYLGPTRLCHVTIKHPPSMADEVEAMRAEQERDIANVEVPAVMRTRGHRYPTELPPFCRDIECVNGNARHRFSPSCKRKPRG